jgi:hypothetical protein
MQTHFYWLVLGLGWDYLATEGIISLAPLQKLDNQMKWSNLLDRI